nr:uncharacterized protein LOC101268668 [Solanum lycopersicum]
MLEENALRQKARARWITLGDTNNKYFSAVIKERNQKKHIRSILSLDGKMLYEPQEIQEEFVKFYKSLMGSSAGKLPAINAQSIGNDKAPGIDGYNELFFKHTWKIVKKDVITAATNFFTKGKLFKTFNCTLVSLIPKVQNPQTDGFIPGRKIAENIILAHELVKSYTRKNISPRSMLKIDLQQAYDLVEWSFLE